MTLFMYFYVKYIKKDSTSLKKNKVPIHILINKKKEHEVFLLCNNIKNNSFGNDIT